MPTVIFAPHKDGQREGSLRKQTFAFLEKLFADDTLPGLHIEPIQNSTDPKVRTGRVNDMFRAVLFKLTSSAGEAHYVFSGVWPHDEAIDVAQRSTLRTNPVNGLPELLVAAEVPLPVEGAEPAAEEAAASVLDEPAEQPSPSVSWLESHSPGVTRERLTDELGIEPDLAARAMSAAGDDELMMLAEAAVQWQGMALLDLAVGKTVEDVHETLRLDAHPEVPGDASADDELLAGMRTPAAQMQFAWLEDDDELRRVIEGGDFEQWRTFLHASQRTYVERSWNGSFRLSGGAGTGKTVVLLHRARHLARRDPAARVVLTTYTRNLADDMRRQLRTLDPALPIADKLGEPGIHVTGVDALASSVLRGATPDALSAAAEAVLGPGGNRATGRITDSQRAWRDAIDSAYQPLPPGLASTAFFDAEYAMVIVPNQIRNRDDYLRARRPGRGVRLGRSQRMAVWDVISRYRSAAAVDGAVDFGEACAIAAELCDAAERRPADHVLVDEGQDLTPARWQLLRSVVDEGPDDLFIAEDS
ncbi:MAG TPA: UvrD-helicase domain-containing protein, partial [Nocardioidaceae bacterium]|nr:UvrD-helicase domain-containing protein [Nocardioidaceae bacterium]